MKGEGELLEVMASSIGEGRAGPLPGEYRQPVNRVNEKEDIAPRWG
jgi:hypothetical protein